MIRYFTSWYNEPNDARRAELITCIQKCCDSQDIDFVYLLCEAPAPIMHEKLKEIPVSTRVTYDDFILLANAMSEAGDVVLINNIDIFPAPKTRTQLERIQPNQAWALSRWDVQADGSLVHFCRKDTADTWCFRAPIKKVSSNFYLAIPGCDNAFAYRLQQAGYEVSNPSKDVKFCHLHLTGVRNYVSGRDSIPAPYLMVEPTSLLVQ